MMTERERLPWLLCAITTTAMLFFAYCWATVKPTVVEIEKRVEVPNEVIKTVEIIRPEIKTVDARPSRKHIIKPLLGHWGHCQMIHADKTHALGRESYNTDMFLSETMMSICPENGRRSDNPIKITSRNDDTILSVLAGEQSLHLHIYFSSDYRTLVMLAPQADGNVFMSEIYDFIDDAQNPE